MKKKILKKIDLLLISLEVLNVYFTEEESTLKIKKLHTDLKNDNSNTVSRFIKLIEYIYKINLIINKYLLGEIASEILKNYAKSKKCNSISKYHKKFYNRCCSKKEYYKNYKLLYRTQKININNIAFINLYIISQSIKKDGVYLLIKYLST
uniref:hypothetical protein n=1 Tax=Aphanocladia delicatula TaxID=3041656 RepID=UPI002551DB2F|nr:hypothetical protein QQP87_pgp008 [Aphanocladia delicatula]WGH14201.1 hypothetical protein [Aphanocladia delicatula]